MSMSLASSMVAHMYMATSIFVLNIVPLYRLVTVKL